MVWRIGLWTVLVAAGLAGCAPREQAPAMVTHGTVNVGPAGQVRAGTVSTDYLATYGIVLVNESGPVAALLPRCTHDGAPAVWTPEKHQFVCKKDQSHYSLLGTVTRGPALRPLPLVRASENLDGTLSVNLDKLYGR